MLVNLNLVNQNLVNLIMPISNPVELRPTDSRGRLSPHAICSTAGLGRAACHVDRLPPGAPGHKIPFRYRLSF
jgi:hypothetical protein